MRILVDADGCPVVDAAVEAALQNKLACFLICDTAHFFDRAGAETIVVEKGADSADFKLVNMIQKGDIVVTQDYGLAAMAMSRGAAVLNQNGLIFHDGNIGSLLMTRHISKKIRNGGGRIKGPPKRTAEQDELFIRSLNRLIKGE